MRLRKLKNPYPEPKPKKVRHDRYYRRIAAALALFALLGLFGLSLAGYKAYGSLNCRTVFRNKFHLLSRPLQAVKDLLNSSIDIKLRNRKPGEKVVSWENSRVAQSEKVTQRMKEFDQRVKEYAEKHKVDEAKAYEEVSKQLEAEMVEAMKNKKTYPSLEDMLAVMAYRSPTFRHEFYLFLENHTSVRWQYRWKFMAHFAEAVRTSNQKVAKWWANRKLEEYFALLQEENLSADLKAKYQDKFDYYFEKAIKSESEVGLPVTYGRRFFELWQRRMRVPTRKMWTSEDFHSMLMEFTDTLFAVNHPESFYRTWTRAFTHSPWDASTWEVMRRFADNVSNDYRTRYKSFLEGAAYDAYGTPRPEVLAEFYKFGFIDTVTRRLVAIVRERHRIWSEIQAEPGKWNKLKSGLAKALDDDIVLKKEVELLTIEMMYVIKPMLEGMFLYLAVDFVTDEVDQRQKGKAYLEDLQMHPEKVLPQNKRATNDMIRGLEDEIYGKTMTLRKIEQELKSGKLSDEEEKKLLADKAALERRIGIVTKLKEQKIKSMERLAPKKE